jgi:tetratricopeptide (TPR) repeat protein
MPPEIEAVEVRRAIERARQEVLDNPRSGAAWGHLGMVLEAHLYEAEAGRCFAEAARLDPADPRWPYFRGLIALKYDPDNALPFLRQAIACPHSPEQGPTLRLRLAEALLERRDLDEAEKLFRAEWRRAPDNHRAVFGLGLVAVARGDPKAAAGFLTAARASQDIRKRATAQLAALARARGDEAAAANYEKELAALPNDPLAWPDPLVEQIVRLQVGPRNRDQEIAQLEQKGRFAEAAKAYLEEIEVRPTGQAYVGAGVNLARLGDYDRAVPLLREGVRRGRDNTNAHYTLSLVLFSRAEKEWQQRPGSARAREWFREAIVHARRATELKPDHARAYLHWGLALKYLGQAGEAVAPLRKGVACRPGEIELQLALGEALLEVGQFQEAQTHLENAHQLDGKDPRPGKALQRLRQKKGANQPALPPGASRGPSTVAG